MDQITSTVLELCLISMPFAFALKMCTLSETKSNVGIGDISQNWSINQYRSGVVVQSPMAPPLSRKTLPNVFWDPDNPFAVFFDLWSVMKNPNNYLKKLVGYSFFPWYSQDIRIYPNNHYLLLKGTFHNLLSGTFYLIKSSEMLATESIQDHMDTLINNTIQFSLSDRPSLYVFMI